MYNNYLLQNYPAILQIVDNKTKVKFSEKKIEILLQGKTKNVAVPTNFEQFILICVDFFI